MYELRKSVVNEQELQTSPEVLNNSILQFRQRNKTMRAQVDSMKTRLTDFTNQGEIIEALTKEIRRCGVELVVLKPEKPQLRGRLILLPIKLQASGSFKQVSRLVFVLESKGSNYQIRRFSQQIIRKGSVKTKFELDLDVIIHKRGKNEDNG
ncbi:MAG: type 4a pilus biogenesis protein PilO [Calditrichia bacterium]